MLGKDQAHKSGSIQGYSTWDKTLEPHGCTSKIQVIKINTAQTTCIGGRDIISEVAKRSHDGQKMRHVRHGRN